MARPSTPPAWYAAFGVAVVALIAGVFTLGLALDNAFDVPGTVAAVVPVPRDDIGPGPSPLTYTGKPIARLAELGLIEAPGSPDIEEVDSGGPTVVTRWWAPVTTLSAGVDSISTEQLRAVVSGSAKSWHEAGGLPTPIQLVLIEGQEVLLSGWGLTPGGDILRVPNAEAAANALSAGSGRIAVLPLEALRPGLVPLAIDEADIARGQGSAAAWPFAERRTFTARSDRGWAALPRLLEMLEVAPPQPFRIAIVGDILQSRCTLAKIEASGDWGAALRGPMADYLAAADLAMGSLDGSIQDIGQPYRCVAVTNLTSPPQVIEALTLAGFDAISVATNHAFDCGTGACGAAALFQSVDRLRAAGIQPVGGGRTLEEALAPARFEVNGIRIGVLAFDDVAAQDLEATESEPGTAPMDDSYDQEREAGSPAFFQGADILGVSRLADRVRRLKAEVDVVIVLIQTGTEDTHAPTERSIKALRAAVDAGATLAVGNQAHWVQALEVRGDALITYANGNFIFDQVHTPEHTEGYVLEATFHGARLVAVRLLPYVIVDQHRPTFLDNGSERRLKVLADILDASAELPAP